MKLDICLWIFRTNLFFQLIATILQNLTGVFLQFQIAVDTDESPHDFGELEKLLLYCCKSIRKLPARLTPSEISKAVTDISDSLNSRASSLLDLRKPQEAEERWNRALSILRDTLLRDVDIWIDLVRWKTVEEANNGETEGTSNPASHGFYSFVNKGSCKHELYSVVKGH